MVNGFFPDEPVVTELVLEPNQNPSAKTFQQAIYSQRILLTAFQADDIQNECQRLKKLGVVFKQEPTLMGPVTQAVFDDTCGNLIQIYQA